MRTELSSGSAAHFAYIPQLLSQPHTLVALAAWRQLFFLSFQWPRQLAGTDDGLISFCFHPPQNTVSLFELQSPDHRARHQIGWLRWARGQLTKNKAPDWARVSQSTSFCSRAECVQKSHEGRMLWDNTHSLQSSEPRVIRYRYEVIIIWGLSLILMVLSHVWILAAL